MSDNIAIMEKRIELIKSIKDAGLNFEQASILFQINEKDNTPNPAPNTEPAPAAQPASATPAPTTTPEVPAAQPTVPPVVNNNVVEGNPLTNILFGNN